MAEDRAERRLTTILAADVVGYSRLMAADEAGTLTSLKALRREVFEPKTAEYRGRVVKLMGDGTLLEFGSVVDAVAFAVDVQRTMALRNADSRKTGSSPTASESTSATSSSRARTYTATGSTSRRAWRHWRSRAASVCHDLFIRRSKARWISRSRIWASERLKTSRSRCKFSRSCWTLRPRMLLPLPLRLSEPRVGLWLQEVSLSW